MFKKTMIKALRIISWLYLIAYVALCISMVVLMATIEKLTLSLFIEICIITIPAIILVMHLKNIKSHIIVYIVGILIMLYPLSKADLFIELEGITSSFYITFTPMIVLLLIAIVSNNREKHNKALNTDSAKNAAPVS